jgi:hypothetical protein
MHNPMETAVIVKKIAQACQGHEDLKTRVAALSICLAFCFNEIEDDEERQCALKYAIDIIDDVFSCKKQVEQVIIGDGSWLSFLGALMAA